MRHWDVRTAAVEPRKPVVLHSDHEGRTIALTLASGDRLGDHEVHERTWLLVLRGEIEVSDATESVKGTPGFLAIFEPGERHEVVAIEETRLLLVLAPWPGRGHPQTRQTAGTAE